MIFQNNIENTSFSASYQIFSQKKENCIMLVNTFLFSLIFQQNTILLPSQKSQPMGKGLLQIALVISRQEKKHLGSGTGELCHLL